MEDIYLEKNFISFYKDSNNNPVSYKKMVLTNVINMPVAWVEIFKTVFITGVFNVDIKCDQFNNSPSEFKELAVELYRSNSCIVWYEKFVKRYVKNNPNTNFIEEITEPVGVKIDECRITHKLETTSYVSIYTPYDNKSNSR